MELASVVVVRSVLYQRQRLHIDGGIVLYVRPGVKRATLSLQMWRVCLSEEEVFRRGALLRVWIQDESNFSRGDSSIRVWIQDEPNFSPQSK